MASLLHLDASARTERSISRDLSASFIETWRKHRPQDAVIRRDLATDPPGFVTQDWIAACFTPESARTDAHHAALKESDDLIAELEQATLIVLGTPMYNYGLPAALKAWVDQVVRVNRTFSFDLARGDYPLAPILSGKTLVCLASKGEFGFAQGGIREDKNHLDPHIETFAPYLGVEECHFISVEYQEFGDERHERSRAAARQNAVALAETLARSLEPLPGS
ncbi:FMN-dependent NADH-azoreductase [Pelagibius sp. Alg239-R121]|uniref:FMN-dependent NADH-azoreductase n=1 Tax=Pelagibius sp. Alg239-R121 TaxID=2993448 RepID=UPI0024A6EF30|nr:NAD(P)H-dependent oxidoreductase [Pelagibius sp. Alg239-R121]